MPRGIDTSRHEGRKVHRDTPRIASLLADHLNESVVYPAQNQIDDMRQTLGHDLNYAGFTTDAVVGIADDLPARVKEYSPEDAQRLLNDYRSLRDRAARPATSRDAIWTKKMDMSDVEDYQSDLGAILRNR